MQMSDMWRMMLIIIPSRLHLSFASRCKAAAVKVLDVKIMFRKTWSTPSSSDDIMAVLNALPLQVNATVIL